MSSKYPSLVETARSAIVGSPRRSLTSEQREAQEELRTQLPTSGDFQGEVIIPFYESRAALSATGTTSVAGDQGGNTIAHDIPEIGAALRASYKLGALGAREFGGLVANTGFPRAKPSLTASWLSENAAGSNVTELFSLLDLSPKRLTAFMPVSIELLSLQKNIEKFLRMELMGTLGAEIQRAAIGGLGASNEPRGIINTTGIGSVVGGVNGAAPTYANLLDLEYAVTGTAKADRGNCAWLVSPYVRRKLRNIFVNGTGSDAVWSQADANSLLGHPAGVTPSSPDTLTKGTAVGTCSSIAFGEMSELILGLWGPGIGVSAVYDTAGHQAGTVLLVASVYFDCGVRSPEAFAVMSDALAA